MSTSLLYHGFAIRGYRYRKTDYVNGDVAFTIEQERKALRCAASDLLIHVESFAAIDLA